MSYNCVNDVIVLVSSFVYHYNHLMFWSRFFCFTNKQNYRQAHITSHQLMLRACLINQSSSGLYSWLPLGWKVLQRIMRIIEEEQDKIGAQRVHLSIMQNADIWKRSGRYDAYGEEMLRVSDRSGKELIFSPTNEEQFTVLFGDYVTNYKAMPTRLYHINTKYRDEIRPRFGVMRAKEFIMKDAYSFDTDEKLALVTYRLFFMAYMNTFRRMSLNVVPVLADPGVIGGEITHEFHVLSPFGENIIYYDPKIINSEDYESLVSYRAFSHERMIRDNLVLSDEIKSSSIEIGHAFYFGDVYSKPLNVVYTDKDNEKKHPFMGSYGIGVTRLVAAAIESNYDEHGIIWPLAIAPFQVCITILSMQDTLCIDLCMNLYNKLVFCGWSVLLDERALNVGEKLNDVELIGIPVNVIAHTNNSINGMVEFRLRNDLTNLQLVHVDQIVDLITKIYAKV